MLGTRGDGRTLAAADRAEDFAYPEAEDGVMPGFLGRLLQRHGLLGVSFWICVLLPTVIGALYVLLLAPSEYVAEFRVVVRSAVQEDVKLSSILGSTMSSAASLFAPPSDSTQNAFMVADYIRSRNMIEGLGGKARLLQVYAPQKGGWLSSLPADSSLEKVWKAWQAKLRIQIDNGPGILTVQVRAYTPEDALVLAQGMIGRSEAMVNEVSQRSRADALARAQADVLRAQDQVAAAHQALLTFRNGQQVIDPGKDAEAIGTLITGLLKERMTIENERAAMGRQTPDSPVAGLAASRLADIDGQIARLRSRLTALGGGNTVSGQLATYETLQLKSQFAEQMYKVAQSAYESARQTRERQQLYLMTIVQPALPQEALYPRRSADIFLVFGVCLILWSIGALITAAVLDHVN